MANVTCLCCGGKDFFLASGFYYCKECQTQTQELLEQEFDEHHTTIVVNKIRSSKEARKKRPAKAQITTWESYNYIILGLVNELIELGADESLKTIVQSIWFKYLKKIEVLHKETTKMPYLPAYKHKDDAFILYGRKDKIAVRKKRKRSRSVSSVESGSVKLQNRLKKALAVASYQVEASQQSETDFSLNTSLESLQGSSVTNKDTFLKFNKSATRELLKNMSKKHLKEHKQDTNTTLGCHHMTSRNVSSKYRRGLDVLNQSKIFAIIYLGLLINKESIQLGDLIRFISEGHLSFNYFKHFFPEEIEDQKTFLDSIGTKPLKHDYLRSIAGTIAVSLQIGKSIPMQNLVELCRRYCKELNLPREILKSALNLLTRTQPKMPIHKSCIPNYEARIMSIIIFVLKMFFGVDDVTEVELSKLACKLSSDYEQMFSFCDWLKYILYRNFVISKHHFPTAFLNKCDDNSKLYVDFIKAHHYRYDLEKCEDVDYDMIDRLVFGNFEEESHNLAQFAHSLTPFIDYLNVLKENKCLECSNYCVETLMKSFENDNVDFLFNPHNYFGNVQVINAGANENIIFKCLKHANKHSNSKLQSISCSLIDPKKVTLNLNKNNKESSKNKNSKESENFLKIALEKYNQLHKVDFEKRQIKKKPCDSENNKISNQSSLFSSEKSSLFSSEKSSRFSLENEETTILYKPESRFWINSLTDFENFSNAEFEKYFETLPCNFRHILNECSRIISQSTQDLCKEYLIVEKYLCFHYLDAGNSEEKLFGIGTRFTTKNWKNVW